MESVFYLSSAAWTEIVLNTIPSGLGPKSALQDDVKDADHRELLQSLAPSTKLDRNSKVNTMLGPLPFVVLRRSAPDCSSKCVSKVETKRFYAAAVKTDFVTS
eukprot:39329-Prorocentrum_lima.AAC.1